MDKKRDEEYVIDLCDEILGVTSLRQHRFDFLRGDSMNGKQGKMLPVDAYYESLGLVVEYYEKQHTEDVKIFDKKMTISGCTRKEQRKIYDERRREVLPKHNIDIVIISYVEFEYDGRKRIVRNKARDLAAVSKKLERFIDA